MLSFIIKISQFPFFSFFSDHLFESKSFWLFTHNKKIRKNLHSYNSGKTGKKEKVKNEKRIRKRKSKKDGTKEKIQHMYGVRLFLSENRRRRNAHFSTVFM